MVDEKLSVLDSNVVKYLGPVFAGAPIVVPDCDGMAVGKGLGGMKYLVLWRHLRLRIVECLICLSREGVTALLQIGFGAIFFSDLHKLVVDLLLICHIT